MCYISIFSKYFKKGCGIKIDALFDKRGKQWNVLMCALIKNQHFLIIEGKHWNVSYVLINSFLSKFKKHRY